MRSFLSAFAALCALIFASATFAAVPKVSGWSWQGGIVSTQEEACNLASQSYIASWAGSNAPTGTVVLQGTGCVLIRSNGSGYTLPVGPAGATCPPNSTPNASGTCDCQAGFAEVGGQCVDPGEQCKAAAGEISTMNYTRGWALSALPNKMDQLGATAKVPSGICNGGCRYAVLGNEAAYRSQTPSPQGLYRLSSDVTVIQTDQPCSEQTAEVDPNTPNEPCPGTLGELNGKPYCAPGPNKPPPEGPPGEEPDDKGNPEAGKKPSTGEGSGQGGVGRTPTNGNGGNNGGPAGAAFGGSGKPPGADDPDGTTDKPDEGKEQENCGAPGQPACKLDESGTPGSFAPPSGVTEYKQSMDAAREQIKGAGDSIFGGMNVFFNAPPLMACSPFELPNEMGTVDPCQVADGVRSIMAYIWALCAMWLCLGWIREAV